MLNGGSGQVNEAAPAGGRPVAREQRYSDQRKILVNEEGTSRRIKYSVIFPVCTSKTLKNTVS
jgi:hypothetical protein